jgi:hypothetical protein
VKQSAMYRFGFFILCVFLWSTTLFCSSADSAGGAVDAGNQQADAGTQLADALDVTSDSGSNMSDSASSSSLCPPPNAPPLGSAGPGERFETYIPSTQGNVAVRVRVPSKPRYIEHTQVVVNVATFFTKTAPFYSDINAQDAGLIHISYIWPGAEEPSSGACSDGVFDHGGPTSIEVLRDVIRYALGDLADIESKTLSERVLGVTPGAVGIWAFSHPGIAAMNVLGRHQDTLGDVAWFVGRENPTQGQHCAVEFGHFGENGTRVLNPLYDYSKHYASGIISFDHASAKWNPDHVETGHEDEPGRAYFDLDGDGFDTTEDHVLSFRVPTMWGKRYLSRSLTQALRDNGLTAEEWPDDLATPEEADAAWAERISINQYPALKGSGLRVMLMFATRQHVQPLHDALSIHSAYDGFKEADLWVRINPDRAYSEWATGRILENFVDHDANDAPTDWSDAGAMLGYPDINGLKEAPLLGLACLAEMADRHEFNRWEENLDETLVPNFPAPKPEEPGGK